MCQLLNDDLAATVKENPKKFIALGTLPMQAPELAVKELERCVKVSKPALSLPIYEGFNRSFISLECKLALISMIGIWMLLN